MCVRGWWAHRLAWLGGLLAAVAGIPVLPLGAADFRQSTASWQQVSQQFGVVLGLEREVFVPSDVGGRFVIALQCGSAAKAKDFEAGWAVWHKGAKVAEGTGSLATGMVVVDFDLAGLAPGDYEVRVEVRRQGRVMATETRSFAVEQDTAPQPAQKGRVPLIFPQGIPKTAQGYPVSFGVPFPKGALRDLKKLRVVDAKGREVPAQFQVRGQWAPRLEAGVRWLGVDLTASESAAWWPERKKTPLFLEYGGRAAKAKPRPALDVQQEADGIHVNTGPLSFLVRSEGFNLLDNVTLNGDPVMDQGGAGGAYVVDQEGTVYRATNDRKPAVTIEESGPLRTVIRVEGWYVKDGTSGMVRNFRLPTESLCKFITRIEAYAGLPWVRILHTWINTSDSYAVSFKDVGFSLRRPGNVEARFGVADHEAITAEVAPDGVYLLQHLADQFDVCREDGTVLAQGAQSDGTVQAATKDGALLSLANRETWQRFPKEFEVLPGEVRLHLWPAHGKSHPEIDPFSKERFHQLWFAHQGPLLDLRFPWQTLFAVMHLTDNPSTGIYKPGGTAMGGVQSSAMGIAITCDFMVHFGKHSRLADARQDLEAFAEHPPAAAAPEWVAASEAIGPMHPYDPERFEIFEKAAEDALFGIWDLQSRTGEYGMFLYRGWHHSPHTGKGFWWPYRLYSAGHHYDPYIPWLYYARSGDPRLAEMGMAGMRHLTDLGVTHYAHPDYEFREFYSEQPKLVGSTGHTNGFVLWGGDHAILSHQTSYGAMMLAYYLTGDLRFREVVEGEWQHTLLDDRLNPGWPAAVRIRHDKPVPEVNRDNNQGLGEMLDLYQLTWDPRLLALIQPCVPAMEQNMYQWSRELPNVLGFRRTPKLKAQLLQAAEARRKDPSNNLHHAFPPTTAYAGARFALAAWADPARGFEKDALWATFRSELMGWGREAWSGNQPSPAAYKIPDYLLSLPLQMKVAEPLMGSGWKDRIRPAQNLPIASELGGSKLSHIVVREDKDQKFTLTFRGKIASPTAKVTVTAPDGSRVVEKPMPPGDEFRIEIPADGQTGEYVVSVRLQANQDAIRLPISSLKKEVYVVSYWIEPNPQCFFLGAANGQNAMVEIVPGKNAFTLESVSDFQVLGSREVGDYEAPFQCPLPPDGAWFITTNGRYFATPKGAPLVFSLSPDGFFRPAHPEKLP